MFSSPERASDRFYLSPFQGLAVFLPSFPVVSQSLTTGYCLLRLQRKNCVESNAWQFYDLSATTLSI